MNEFIESLKAETNSEPANKENEQLEEVNISKLIEELMRKRNEEVWEK